MPLSFQNLIKLSKLSQFCGSAIWQNNRHPARRAHRLALEHNANAAINIRHMGHTGEDVIAASLRLAGETPRIMDDIRRMQGVELPYRRQVDFVHEAARLRLGDDYEDRIRPEALLSPRRWNDIGFTAGGLATVWQCFNRVQENLIRGGVPLKPQEGGAYRRRSLRALNGIDGNTRLNRELWDLADSYTLHN